MRDVGGGDGDVGTKNNVNNRGGNDGGDVYSGTSWYVCVGFRWRDVVRSKIRE